MRPRLAKLLDDGWAIRRCTVARGLYLPGEGCTLRYTVELTGPGSGQPTKHLIAGRVLPGATAAGDWLRGRLVPLAVEAGEREDLDPFIQPVAAVEQLHLVLHAFPIDPELPGLLAATDPERALELAQAAVPDARTCRVELVAYDQRDRCVLRYHLDEGGPRARTVDAKVYADGLGEVQRRAADGLRDAVGDAFGLARVLAYHDEQRLALIEPVTGTPRVAALVKQRADGDALEDDLRACARLAAAIHGAPVTIGPARTIDGELAALRRELIAVGSRTPALGVRLSRWLAPVEAAASATEPLPPGPAHGDLTPAQVLFDGDRCGLTDLDTVCRAEPSLDLGHFLAHLRLAVARADRVAGAEPDDRADRLAALVLATYAEAAGIDLDQLRRRSAVFEALSLARIALRSWEELEVARLIDVLRLMDTRPSPVPETAA
jgi:hypothetical protein